eukprot:133821-Pyramimonas_sp.AAC.1
MAMRRGPLPPPERHVAVVHGPPGTGKTVFFVATMDTWAVSLPEGQAVALTAGSNAAADQPAFGLGSAHEAGRLGHRTSFPNICVRLAKEFR